MTIKNVCMLVKLTFVKIKGLLKRLREYRKETKLTVMTNQIVGSITNSF